MLLQATSGYGRGKKTATAGTRIRALIPGSARSYGYVTFLSYTAQGTAHTLTLMRGQSDSKATAAVAEGGTALVVNDALLDGGGNAIAASDVLAIQTVDGNWYIDVVSAYSASTKTITLTSGPATGSGGIAKGGKVVCYGVAGDTNHGDFQFAGTASATTNYPAVAHGGPLCRSRERNEPIVFDSDNATAAGTLQALSGVFGDR